MTKNSDEMIPITESEFSKHLNSNFNLRLSDGNLQLELIEVKAYRPQEHEQQGMERFSALFNGPGGLLLPQGLYQLSHDQMGDIDLFLVPVSGDQRGCQYEAVFNHFKNDG